MSCSTAQPRSWPDPLAGPTPAGSVRVNDSLSAILERMRLLELELKAELARHGAAHGVRLRNGRIHFDEVTRRRHASLKVRLPRYLWGGRPLLLLTVPFIYLVAVPLALLDLVLSLYQAVCFPIYGIARVPRRDYLVFDRARLGYLNVLERFHCAYCSYANGLLAYAREVVARTEQYWCPIKHSRGVAGTHARYPRFFAYGDAEAYRRQLKALRAGLRDEPPEDPRL